MPYHPTPMDNLTEAVSKCREDRGQWCPNCCCQVKSQEFDYVRKDIFDLPILVCHACAKILFTKGWNILPF